MKSKIYNYVLVVIIILVMSNLNFAQWTKLTEIPTARTFAASCEVDSIIYVLGGTGSTNTNGSGTTIMDVYNPILNSWDTTKANMPTGRVELGVCAVNKKIYAIGGSANHSSSPLGMVEEYDPLTDTWNINKTPMPTPRKGAAFGVIDNKIYVAGGTAVSDFTASGKLEIYDPVTNTWDVTKKPMPQSMYQPQGAVVNDKFYVIGGLLGSAPWTGQKIVQMYDPVTDTWSYMRNLNTGRVGHTASVVDSKIYVIGGDKQPPPVRTVEEYDSNSNTWAVIDSISRVMVCHTASVVGNKVYVISGSTSPIHPNLNPTNAVYSYQLSKHAQLLSDSFEFEGLERRYEVYLPGELKENMPLIISLHGYNEDFKWYRDYTQLHKSTDTAGYVLVCPQAINLTWNIGILEDPDGVRNFNGVKDVNDVEFISTLIDTICNNYSIDMKRIYCCGFSTGGEMSLVLACCLGHRFAAAASVAGGLYDPAASWNPCKPMPVLEIHGTKENLFSPYEGRGSMWSVAKTINYWIERNKITDPPDTVQIPDIVTSDNCTVEKINYTGGLNESEVIHYKVIGGGHSWPGSKTSFGAEGNKNLDISANTEILKFFSKFDNPYYNIANPKSFDISPKNFRQEGDTLTIIANLVNPENHSVSVYGIITGEEQDFKDSLQLFDDGLHNDVNALDNIFGGSKWLNGLDEDFYKLKIRVTDLEDLLTSYSHFNYIKYFTTAGPLKLDSVSYTKNSNRHYYNIKSFVRNDGNNMTIKNAEIKLYCNDPWVGSVSTGNSLPDIAPGATVSSNSNTTIVYIDSLLPNLEYFNLTAEITVNGQLFWTDSIHVITTGIEEESSTPLNFTLSQNYPNPFNPSTKIRYSIPKRSNVTIKIYDILGKELTTLVNEEKQTGSHELIWNASNFPSGVYFYQLRAGDFIKTKKMILLR